MLKVVTHVVSVVFNALHKALDLVETVLGTNTTTPPTS
jgi:hypothetical protein